MKHEAATWSKPAALQPFKPQKLRLKPTSAQSSPKSHQTRVYSILNPVKFPKNSHPKEPRFGAELQAESSALRVIAVTAGALQEWPGAQQSGPERFRGLGFWGLGVWGVLEFRA